MSAIGARQSGQYPSRRELKTQFAVIGQWISASGSCCRKRSPRRRRIMRTSPSARRRARDPAASRFHLLCNLCLMNGRRRTVIDPDFRADRVGGRGIITYWRATSDPCVARSAAARLSFVPCPFLLVSFLSCSLLSGSLTSGFVSCVFAPSSFTPCALVSGFLAPSCF